jgi:tetratricopeptide (TPR) repeat protein
MTGDAQGEIADYTTVVELPDAPKELVAIALVNRGHSKGIAGDAQGEIADYTAVVELPDTPEELVANALFNRGVAKRMGGDTQGAIADYTAVVELPDAPKKQVAKALYNRGVAKGMTGDTQGAIADYTAVVELPDAPKEQVAKALFHRGIAGYNLRHLEEALSDWMDVIRITGTPLEARSNSAVKAFSACWQDGQVERARSILTLFTDSLRAIDHQEKGDCLVRLLAGLASPEMREAWPQAWRAVSQDQPPEVAEALKVFKPVSRILEGAERSILDALPPEERAFAERILERFKPAKG